MTITIIYSDYRNKRSLVTRHYSYAAAQGSLGVMQSVGFTPVHISVEDEILPMHDLEIRLLNYIPECYEKRK